MKKFIKLIISLCLITVIGIVGFMFIKNKIVPNINNGLNNNGGNNGNSSQNGTQLNGNTDNSNFEDSNLAIDVKELSKSEKTKSLENAKSNIAKEDIKNTYTTLFDNKTYTNSNYKYELNENTVSVGNWLKFQNDFDVELEKAIARKENFLMYSTHGLYHDAYYAGGQLILSGYLTPLLIYGYVEGLGYIIGINNGGTLELTVENKYYSKFNTYHHKITYNDGYRTTTSKDEYIYDALTLKSNNDTVKVATGVLNNDEVEYAEYVPNMVKTTIAGFTKDDRKSDYYSLENNLYKNYKESAYEGYNFYEGNFMNIIGENKAYHLYGMGYYESRTRNSSEYDSSDNYTYHPEKDNEFFWYDDPISLRNSTNTKYLTDFNNFFMACGDGKYANDISYAMFGNIADIYLKKIVTAMFSGDIKECNDFSNDNVFEKKDNCYNISYDNIDDKDSYTNGDDIDFKSYPYTMDSTVLENAFNNIFWTINNEGSESETNNYIYPITKKEADAYANKKEYVSTDASGKKHYYTCNASWYESLAEEDKPYIISYVVTRNKLTVRRWQREWYYPIGTTLDDNTLVFEKDVETYLEFAKKAVEDKFNVYYDEERGAWMATNLETGELQDLSGALKYCLPIARDITTVTDETNVFNSRFN